MSPSPPPKPTEILRWVTKRGWMNSQPLSPVFENTDFSTSSFFLQIQREKESNHHKEERNARERLRRVKTKSRGEFQSWGERKNPRVDLVDFLQWRGSLPRYPLVPTGRSKPRYTSKGWKPRWMMLQQENSASPGAPGL